MRGLLVLSNALFYDRNRVAIVLMSLCFSGYDAKKSNAYSHKICGQKRHDRLIADLPDVRLWVLIDALAHRYHLGLKTSVRETFAGWHGHAPYTFVLPHPSWRNTGWLKKNLWLAEDVLPALCTRMKEVIKD